MQKMIQLTDQPINKKEIPSFSIHSGSVVEFWGVVRENEAGQKITYLDYEAYPEMAEYQIQKIIDELEPIYPCDSFSFIHRLGKVPVGEASLWIQITSKHRKEGFGFLTEFCNRLKQDVPIWKSAPNL
ncbi:MAG: molybdenum cofactor biosynthesis protein MoaE [Verrucomicrobiia bacterium]